MEKGCGVVDFDFNIDNDTNKIIEKSVDPEKTSEIVLWLAGRCREKSLPFTSYQWMSLVNHISAMIERSKNGGVLDIDVDLFDEVSEDSLSLSEEVVNAVGNIADEEKYLISIHFEGVKENI